MRIITMRNVSGAFSRIQQLFRNTISPWISCILFYLSWSTFFQRRLLLSIVLVWNHLSESIKHTKNIWSNNANSMAICSCPHSYYAYWPSLVWSLYSLEVAWKRLLIRGGFWSATSFPSFHRCWILSFLLCHRNCTRSSFVRPFLGTGLLSSSGFDLLDKGKN